MNMCVCVHLAELYCACVLVLAHVIVLFVFMSVCMRVYVWMYVIDCVREIACTCRHTSVWQSGCVIV
jgi:hypothetical protein